MKHYYGQNKMLADAVGEGETLIYSVPLRKSRAVQSVKRTYPIHWRYIESEYFKPKPEHIATNRANFCDRMELVFICELYETPDAAEKKARLILGNPVVNMWCTHRPKDRNAVPTAASTIHG